MSIYFFGRILGVFVEVFVLILVVVVVVVVSSVRALFMCVVSIDGWQCGGRNLIPLSHSLHGVWLLCVILQLLQLLPLNDYF